MNSVIWNIVTVIKHKKKKKKEIRDFILAIFQTCIRFACIFKNTEEEYRRYAWKVSKTYFILGIYNSLRMLKSLSCIPLRGKRPHRRCALVRRKRIVLYVLSAQLHTAFENVRFSSMLRMNERKPHRLFIRIWFSFLSCCFSFWYCWFSFLSCWIF